MKLTFSVGGAETVDFDRNYCYSSGKNILTLGASSYVNGLNLWLGGKNIPHHVLIGRFCSLSWELVFLITYNHNYKSVSTYPKFNNPAGLNLKNSRQVIVGHDVWIGYGATIMGGVKIGNGAVVGARAVVAKDIPPYAIAVGNPARVVKYRFDEMTIKKLLAVKWWNWSLEKLADNLSLMTDVEKFLELHYSPEFDAFPEDDISRRLSMCRGGIYHFIADFRAQHPLWPKVVRDFAESDFKDKLFVIWLGKDTTDEDFNLLTEAVNLIGNGVEKNILAVDVEDKNFSPTALRKGTHFITTREMTTLEALDYLWDTDVKIVSALDDGIFA